MSPILTIAAPVFAIMLAGLCAGRFGGFPAADVAALNRFVFNAAMPAALFSLTASADPIAPEQVRLALAYAGAVIVAIALAYAIGRAGFSLTGPEAGAHAFASSLGNAVFLGLPIALAINGWAEHFVVLMLVEGVGVIAIAMFLIDPSAKAGIAARLIGPFRNPLVAAMIAGFLVSAATRGLGLDLPQPLAAFLQLLGRAGGPAALFSLGLFFAVTPAPPLSEVGGKVGSIVLIKMIALPAMTLLGMGLLGVDDKAMRGAAMLFTLVPTGAAVFVIAGRFGVYTKEAAAAVATTTVISLFTIAGVLAFFA